MPESALRLVHDLANNYQAVSGYVELGENDKAAKMIKLGITLLRKLDSNLKLLQFASGKN